VVHSLDHRFPVFENKTRERKERTETKGRETVCVGGERDREQRERE
jgi:hypothetical protein